MSREYVKRFHFYPADFLVSRQIILKNMEERGQLITEICEMAEEGDVSGLKKYPFINKIKLKLRYKRSPIPKHIRGGILSAGSCAFCGSRENLSIDHIIPVSKGGTNDPSNLQVLCMSCNSRKGNRLEMVQAPR